MNALTTTFYQLLSDNLSTRPDKTVLIDPKRAVDYATLAREVDLVARYLKDSGVRPTDRVIVHLRKSIEEVVAMLAISKIGGVIVNVNTQWTLSQLSYVADDSQAKLIITDSKKAKLLADNGLPSDVERVLVHGATPAVDAFDDWHELSGTDVDEAPVLDTALAMIIYTSGSTGLPKGVMLSHHNIVAGARAVARYLKLGESDRLISVLAYNFDAGLNQLTTMLLMGGTIVHQPVVLPAEIVKTIQNQHVTGLAGVPPLLIQIVRLLRNSPAKLPSLQRVTNTGGRIPTDILEVMPEVFPETDIYLMYGLTEAFRSTYLPPEKFAEKMGAIGQAIPGAEVYVIKDGIGVAGPGETGELVHRGPLVSLGYWGRPDLSAEKIRPCPELASWIGDEKVVYSGDIVQIDSDGDLWFVSRNDAMIKTSGIRLSPEEVEDMIYRSGIVADAVAYGSPDHDLGETVHVAVTPLDGFDLDQLRAHCRRIMPSYMVPAEIVVWDTQMPKTATGKLARPEIIKQSSERNSQGSEVSSI